MQGLRDTLCHCTFLVFHRHDVVCLSVRRAALPVAMPPNRPVGRVHEANPPAEDLAPHGHLSPHLVKYSKQ